MATTLLMFQTHICNLKLQLYLAIHIPRTLQLFMQLEKSFR